MNSAGTETVQIRVDASHGVDGLFMSAPEPIACLVLAHGAGAGMQHASMASVADDLRAMGIATLRYQFPYMQRGSRRTDPPALCHATIRAAVATAIELAPSLPLIAGGRSFGGRMTSQAQAIEALPLVRGLAFLAFPLHPAGKPSIERAEHLSNVSIPMLFIQGTDDDLASLDLLQPVIDRLGSRATLKLLQNADHAFHVPAHSGRKDAEVRHEALAALVEWASSLPLPPHDSVNHAARK
jgi:predicted alpha/beta-hydrolase family hydrolase